MSKNEKGFGLVPVLLILILISVLGFAGWSVSRANKTNNTETTASNSETATDKKQTEDSEQSSPKTGTIKGQASYPSEQLPEDEEVCAQPVNEPSAKPICINVGKQQTIKYELTVPEGTYYVYAKTEKLSGYKAYYNEFVKCGLSVDCPESTHLQQIPVKVTAGAVVENVDPGDWYAN
jgi:cytoskeletal protein RodZ